MAKSLKDIMTRDVVCVFPETSLVEAAKIIYQNRFAGVPVVDVDSILIGIITEYDLISMDSEFPTHIPTLQKIFQTIPADEGHEAELEKLNSLKVQDVMNPDPLSLGKDATIDETIRAFKDHHRVNPIPVIDSQRKIVGIVSRSDLVKFFTDIKPSLQQVPAVYEQVISSNTCRIVSKSVALLEEKYQLVNRISEIGGGEFGAHFELFNKLIPKITSSRNIDQALEEVVRLICSSTSWVLGEIWAPHKNQLYLRLKHAWSPLDGEFKEFINYSRGFIFAPGEGLPGRIWITKKPEWQDDVSSAPISNFLRAKFAQESNIRAAFGFPVFDMQGRVIAVIIFFMKNASHKDESFIKFISAVSGGLNLFLRYKLLEERVSLLQSAVGSSNEGILITDPSGEIIFANNAWERLTGYAPNEIIGKSPNQLWGGNMPKEFYSKMWQTIRIEKRPFVGEVENTRKDGSKYWQAIYITPILDECEEIRFYLAIEPDISDKKAKDRFKDEFVSIIGHQLRNPLIGISWLIESLAGRSEMNDEEKEKINEIYSQNKSLYSFVEDLLMLSRAGKSDLKLESMDLKQEIKTIVDEVQARNPNVKVSFEAIEDDASINANRSMAIQVFANLIYNSAEYSDKEHGLTEILLEKKGNEFIFSTRNNGPEITDADKDKIFSKLFRSDAAKEHKKNGTGLGLFIVKTICDSFGWKIWFESGKGEGTSFFVTIPIK